MSKIIEEFIRDMTSVVPRPKSEVRSRLNEIIKAERKQEREEAIEGIERNKK